MFNVGINFLDDAEFKETEHPRGKGGSHGGQFVKKGQEGAVAVKAPKSIKSGVPSQSRAASILQELNARNAPDIDYKQAFSTGSKVPLKRGETWRSRLEAWVASEQGPTPARTDVGPYPPIVSNYHVKPFGMMTRIMDQYTDPQEAAQKIKEIAGQYGHLTIAAYGNTLLRWLEKKHDLDVGSLGKAQKRIIPPEQKKKFKKTIAKALEQSRSTPPPVQTRSPPPVTVEPRGPGKVLKRPKPPSADQISEYALMEEPEFKSLSGMTHIRAHDSRRLQSVGETRAAVMALPKSHRAMLANVKVVNVGEFPIGTQAEVKSDWGYAGLYTYGERTAQIADFMVSTKGDKYAVMNPGKVATHELGHGMDYELGTRGGHRLFASEADDALKGAFDNDRNRLVSSSRLIDQSRRQAAEYYLSNNREMFAETYAMNFHPEQEHGYVFGMPIADARKVFSESSKQLNAYLQQQGLDTYA